MPTRVSTAGRNTPDVSMEGYAAAFNDITAGANDVYAALPSYEDSTGIRTMKPWELAGEE